MNWRSILSLFLMLGMNTLTLADEATIAAIATRLEIASQISGSFVQQKYIPTLIRPLSSSGRFSLAAGGGLHWQVQQPLASEMTVDQNGVLLDGRPIKDHGSGELIAALLQAFLSGDLEALERSFSLSGVVTYQQWHIRLEPRALLLKSVLSHIDVRGDRFLEQIEVSEVGGGRTEIQLDEFSVAVASTTVVATSTDESPR